MRKDDYSKFVTLKDTLYTVCQKGLITDELREKRDKLLLDLLSALYKQESTKHTLIR